MRRVPRMTPDGPNSRPPLAGGRPSLRCVPDDTGVEPRASVQIRACPPAHPVSADRRAQRAARTLARNLCDEIDRTQERLDDLRAQLEDTVSICRTLFDEHSGPD